MTWADMKPVLLNAYAAMLPRLQAEEDLRSYMVVAAGTGSLKDSDRKQWLRDLRRVGQPQRRERAVKSLDGLRAMGIKVTEIPVG